MEAFSTVVIKVKYGDTLRRFRARVVDGELDLDVDGLREKICLLFCFSPGIELLLTYIDEDGDAVTLVDDEDLRDMVKQALNPLRIIVGLNAEANDRLGSLSGSFSTLRSPQAQQHLQKPKSDFSEILRNVQEPLHDTLFKFSTDLASNPWSSAPDKGKSSHNLNSGRSHIVNAVQEPVVETLVKLSTDLASESSASTTGVSDLFDYFSKRSLSYLDQLCDTQPNVKPTTESGVPESSRVATETNDLGHSKDNVATSKVPANGRSEERSIKSNQSFVKFEHATTENNEVKPGNLKKTSSKGTEFVVIASAVDSKSINFGKKEKVNHFSHSKEKHHSTSSHLPPVANNDSFIGKFGEFCCASVSLPSVANNIPTVKEVNKPGEPYSAQDIANTNAPDFVKEGSFYGRTKNASPIGLWSLISRAWVPGSDTLNSPGSCSGTSSMHECPFSGLSVGDMPAESSSPDSEAFPFWKSSSQNAACGPVYHWGVCCDSCKFHPITGPRFKSKVKVDYDLCGICFSKIGNDVDYIRMDSPVVRQPQMSFMGFLDTFCKGYEEKLGVSKLDSSFIHDVNIIDGTVMAPLTPFTKIWRMRNNGMAPWPQKSQLVWIGGDKLSNDFVLEIEIPKGGLPAQQELDIAVNFITPKLPGRYISYWRMASPSGQKFGNRVWVLIEVNGSLKEKQHENLGGLNLNLPPTCGPGNNYGDLGKMVENGNTRRDNSEKVVDSFKPILDKKPDTKHEMKFPINNNLVVGSGISSTDPSAASSVSYPMIDLNDGDLSFSSEFTSSGHLFRGDFHRAPGEGGISGEALGKHNHMGSENVVL